MIQTVFKANIGLIPQFTKPTKHTTRPKVMAKNYRIDDFYWDNEKKNPGIFISYWSKIDGYGEIHIAAPALFTYIHVLFGWECHLPSYAVRAHDNSIWIDIDNYISYSLSDRQVSQILNKHLRND